MGIGPGTHLVLIGAPPTWRPDPLPPGVRVSRRMSATPAEVVVAFFRTRTALDSGARGLAGRIPADGCLWVAWPRRAGGHRSDITDNAVRAALLGVGLVDVKVAALDDDWSALKFVWRRELRPL